MTLWRINVAEWSSDQVVDWLKGEHYTKKIAFYGIPIVGLLPVFREIFMNGQKGNDVEDTA